jgi:hypothetical protein
MLPLPTARRTAASFRNTLSSLASTLVLALAAASPAYAATAVEPRAPSLDEFEEAIPEGTRLTGREIYERYLDNRIAAAHQHQKVLSTDPGGTSQVTRMELRIKDYRDDQNRPVEGIVGKNHIAFESPYDMRGTIYLLIKKDPGPDDEFVYQRSAKRVRRASLKDTSVAGTDFTYNDVASQNVEDADYLRLPDEEIDGVPVYVVEAQMRPGTDTGYDHVISYLEKEHYIALRTRYWDEAKIEVKEARAPYDKIKEFDGVWVATEVTMRDLKQGTSSTLIVERLDPNPNFNDRVFRVDRLAHGH